MSKIRRINLKLPEQTHIKLKTICDKNGQNMQFVIERLIEEYLKAKMENLFFKV